MKAFLNLLDAASKPFTCQLCGIYPRFLGFDGVSLAMRKKNVDWANVDTIYPRTSQTQPLGPTVLKQQDRLMLSNYKVRQQLHLFCTEGVDETQFFDLVEDVATELPSLSVILQSLYADEQVRMQGYQVVFFCFPGIWKELLLALASSSSVVRILLPAVLPALEHLLQCNQYLEAHHEKVSSLCPPLAYLLLRVKDGRLPPALADLLRAMINKVKQVYPGLQVPVFEVSSTRHINISLVADQLTGKKKGLNDLVPGTEDWEAQMKTTMSQIQRKSAPFKIPFTHTDLTEYTIIPELESKKSGTVWPAWPKIRKLPRYEGLDNVKETTETQQWTNTLNTEEEDSIYCVKVEPKGYSHKDLTAGMFIGCCPHTIGYGFHSMVAPEGRKDLLKVLYERMPQEVLDQLLVMFDFNCQEAEYMLNREPEMFKHTQLYIDRFHARTHKCSSVFKLDAYPSLQELISTCNESLNFIMQRLHSQTPYMTQETYIEVSSGVMGVRNALLNKNLLKLQERFEKS